MHFAIPKYTIVLEGGWGGASWQAASVARLSITVDPRGFRRLRQRTGRKQQFMVHRNHPAAMTPDDPSERRNNWGEKSKVGGQRLNIEATYCIKGCENCPLFLTHALKERWAVI